MLVGKEDTDGFDEGLDELEPVCVSLLELVGAVETVG